MVNTDLTIYKNDDITLPLTFTNTDNTAYDLTGSIIFFTVKNTTDIVENDNGALIQQNVTVHTDPVNGLSTISVPKSSTAIIAGIYKYDVQLKDAGSLITTILSGRFIVSDDVTKRIV